MNRKHNFCGRAARIATAQSIKHGASRRCESVNRLPMLVISSLGLAAASILLFAGNTTGATIQWTLPPGQSGDWSVASNWGTGFGPGSSDYAYIGNGGTATITLAGATCFQLLVGSSLPGSVQMVSGSLATSYQTVGASAAGSFVQSGGTNSVSSDLDIDTGSTNSTYALTGSGQLSANNVYVGYSGPAGFTQAGGTVLAWVTLGYGASSSGTYIFSGGSIYGGMTVGYSGTGSLQQSDGTNTSRTIYLGSSNGGSGTYDLTGGMLVSPASTYSLAGEFVGDSGTGTFSQSGGTNTTANPLYIGYYSHGTYSLTLQR